MKNLIKKNQLMITALAIMIAIAGYLQFAGTGLEDEYLTVDDDAMYTSGTSATGATEAGNVVTENYTAEDLLDMNEDGVLDLSDEDLLISDLTDIDSLDSEVEDAHVDNYLDSSLEFTEAGTDGAQNGGVTPDDGEIPGEAVFTASGEISVVLSEAKLLKEQTRARNKETLLEIINSEGITDEQKQTAVDSMVKMTEVAEKEAAAEILLEAKGFTDVVVSIDGDAVDVVVNAAQLDEAMRAQIEDIVTRKTGIAPENIIISTVAR